MPKLIVSYCDTLYLFISIPRSKYLHEDNKQQLITKTLKFKSKRSRTYFAVIIRILSTIYKNLISKKSCTVRYVIKFNTKLKFKV